MTSLLTSPLNIRESIRLASGRVKSNTSKFWAPSGLLICKAEVQERLRNALSVSTICNLYRSILGCAIC